MTVNVRPSIKMLPFPGMVRVVSGAWARADIEALDINATVAAAMTPDLRLGAVIETSCDDEPFWTIRCLWGTVASRVLFRIALVCRFLLVNSGGLAARPRRSDGASPRGPRGYTRRPILRPGPP